MNSKTVENAITLNSDSNNCFGNKRTSVRFENDGVT
jgi:hypothetical protein